MKNWLNKNPKLVFPIGLFLFLAIGGSYIYFILLDEPDTKVIDFKSCVKANNGVVLQIVPAQCVYNGVTYTEEIVTQPNDINPNGEGINLDLPENEKSQIEAWLEENNYNQYGDKVDTIYAGGSPLFNESTGKSILLYDYLVQKYPNKPWLKKTANSNNNSEVKSFTEVKTWKNFENPNFELQYPDFANMSDKNTYPIKFTADNDFEFIIEVSDKQPNYSAGTCEKKLDIDAKSLYLCYNKNITYQEIYQRMLDSFVIR
jgi:hypothetical protein